MRDTVWQNTRAILVLAFGGLLLLIAILGFGAYRRSDLIFQDVTSIQYAYPQRATVLNEIQSDIYLSAILLRDYLLDPVISSGIEHRRQLLEVRRSLEARLKILERLSPPQDRDSLRQLSLEVEGFWDALDPLFEWPPQPKAADRFSFLRKKVRISHTVLQYPE